MWRWEWNSDHKIDKRDRPTLFRLFKALLYARNQDEHQEDEKSYLKTKQGVKAYNLPDFLDIVLHDSVYYVQRIDIGKNSRYLSKKCNIDPP